MKIQGTVEAYLTFWNGNVEGYDPCFTATKCELNIHDLQKLNEQKIRMLPIVVEDNYYFIPYANINQIQILNK